MSNSLRILMVSDVSPLHIAGGAERVLWEQASRLCKRGHRVRIVARAPSAEAQESIERQGVLIRHFQPDRGSQAGFLLSSIRMARAAVSSALAEESADVLQCYQPLSAFGALAARPASLPSLYTFLSPAPLEYATRGGMTRHHRQGLIGRAGQAILWAIERSCLRRVSRIHVLSDFSADQLWRLYRIPADRIVKIPGGVDTERFRPASDRLTVRRTLGLPLDATLLFTVRNLEARMGLDTLIRAIAIVRQALPQIQLLIGGTGSLRAPLEALTASLNLRSHVQFLGYIPDADLSRYYQAADAFVLPSRQLEGFGLPTVESLACGTPALGTQVGATPEILRPLDPALLLRNTAPDVMAEDLIRFLQSQRSSPEADRLLREASRRHAESLYDWNLSVVRLEDTLARLVGRLPSEAEELSACLACGHTTSDPDLVYSGVRYRRCPRCRTLVQSRRPSPEDLRSCYEISYPLRFRPEAISERREELFESILDRLEEMTAHGRLLDVGCGGGHFLSQAARWGWHGLGLDLSLKTCLTARAAGFQVVQASGEQIPFRDESVDTVLLINVLDHTREPLTTLREAHRVLRRGGKLVLRVPNAAFHRPWIRLLTSLGPLVRWHRWDALPILHVYGFTALGLRRLTERVGFSVVALRNSPLAAVTSQRSRAGWLGLALPLAHNSLAASLRAIDRLSGGRWLAGPSIEVYAERPVGTGPDK
jgi:glycosyltransferase involved in cell wall biosynthesis/SAM-dependent methyltransferase